MFFETYIATIASIFGFALLLDGEITAVLLIFTLVGGPLLLDKYFSVNKTSAAVGSSHIEDTTNSSEPDAAVRRTHALAEKTTQSMNELSDSLESVSESVERLHHMVIDLKVKKECPQLFPLFPELWQEPEAPICLEAPEASEVEALTQDQSDAQSPASESSQAKH